MIKMDNPDRGSAHAFQSDARVGCSIEPRQVPQWRRAPSLPWRFLARAVGVPAVTVAAWPTTVEAHALAERYDLPIPLAFYLAAAGATVALSFLLPALIAGWRTQAEFPQWSFGRSSAAALARRAMAVVAAAAGVGVFVLVILAGLVGNQQGLKNIAPVTVWVGWWVGFAFLSALVGNVWPAVDPWRTLFRLAERTIGGGRPRTPPLVYPTRLAAWPAVAFFFAVIWMELVWPEAERPRSLAVAILLYSAVTWSGMYLFGAETWLRNGEAFGIFFATLGRFAPLAADEAAQHSAARLRLPGIGLLSDQPLDPSRLAFVILILSSVTLDGFLETPVWAAMLDAFTHADAGAGLEEAEPMAAWSHAELTTAALVIAPLAFLLVYRATAAAMARTASIGDGHARAVRSAGELARWFVLTLVPIAIAYHFAHYLSYLLLAGQLIVPLASDPFGYGWDLFGTALYRIDIGVIDARQIWYVALFAIVLGHVTAVWLAHAQAIRVFGEDRAALRSQYPMLALMVVYTMSSLWILAQPVVKRGTLL
jgi:hypothetical protein